MPKGQGRRLSFDDGEIVAALIRRNAVISGGENGDKRMVRYKQGWSDAKVCSEASRQIGAVSLHTIITFRNKFIGRIPRGIRAESWPRTPPGGASMLVRMAAAERRDGLLEHRLAAVEQFLIERSGYNPPVSDPAEMSSAAETVPEYLEVE